MNKNKSRFLSSTSRNNAAVDLTNKQNTEQESYESSEELFRATFNQAAVGIAVADFDGHILEANQKCLDLLGYSSEELKALSFIEFTHPDDIDKTKESLELLIQGKIKQYSLEKRYIQKNGTVVWSQTTASVVRDKSGQPVRLVGILEDISSKKDAEYAYKQSEIFNRTIIESSQDCIEILNLDGDIVWQNEAAQQKLSSFNNSRTIGKSWLSFWATSDRANAHNAFNAAKNGTHDNFIGCYIINEKLTYWDVILSPILDLNGKLERILVTCRDINARIHNDKILEEVQNELRIQQMRLASVIQYSEDAIITKNLKGVIQSWNPAAERIFGYSSEEAIGKPIWLIIPPELHHEEDAILSKISKGERLEHFETERIRKDGNRIIVSVTSSPIKDLRGTIIGATKIARDITDRRKHQEKLEQSEASYRILAEDRSQLLMLESETRKQVEESNRMKDQFLATLSHELRTPLNAILGWSQLGAKYVSDPVRVKESFEIIQRNARSQAQIIEDLLDMNRIISGAIRLEMQIVNLQRVIEEAIETVTPAAQAKELTIEKHFDLTLTTVYGDPNRLKQIIWNLLTNAVKFTNTNSNEKKIIVSLVNSGNQVVVEVADFGEGITPEFLPSIFDRFSQDDSSPARRYGGLGLGLSIVKHLVELHGGSISAKSEGKSNGSAFRVSLPMAISHVMENKDSGQRPSFEHSFSFKLFAGLNALVIDDEPDARKLVRNLLEEKGVIVSTASSSQEALKLIAENNFDFILSDIGMPLEDGYHFIRKIREHKQKKIRSIPAIALTAYARREDQMMALQAGFQAHITKPVEATELLTIINSLMTSRIKAVNNS